MPTFLDALADLVDDPAARAAYRLDPAGWLAAHDAAGLSEHDVVAALPALRRWCGAVVPVEASAGVALVDGEPEPAGAVRAVDRLLAALGASGPSASAAAPGEPT